MVSDDEKSVNGDGKFIFTMLQFGNCESSKKHHLAHKAATNWANNYQRFWSWSYNYSKCKYCENNSCHRSTEIFSKSLASTFNSCQNNKPICDSGSPRYRTGNYPFSNNFSILVRNTKTNGIRYFKTSVGTQSQKSFVIQKQLIHLDSFARIQTEEIGRIYKKKSELIDSLSLANIKTFKKFTEVPKNLNDFKSVPLLESLLTLNSALQEQLRNQSAERQIMGLDKDSLRKVLEILELKEDIRERQKFVDLVKSIKKALCSIFRKFQINRRERFRKIYSFIFKNLDDYHSLSLASKGY